MAMKTVLTVIVDNTAAAGARGEWGLSILVEHRGQTILVDAGASDLFAENLSKLGFDIKEVDFGVLSHAHYDHANGLPTFFEQNSKAKFYLRDQTAADCYGKKFIFRKYIGIPKSLIDDYADRISLVSGDYELCDGAYLVPHKTDGLEEIGRREKMYRRNGHRFRPDDFSHEQSLVLDTERGLVIINSCSHGGAVNIINEVKATFPDKQIYGLIGGFHLFNKSDEEVRRVGREIKATGVEYVCTGHCTGDRPYGILKEELGDRLEQLRVGLRIEK